MMFARPVTLALLATTAECLHIPVSTSHSPFAKKALSIVKAHPIVQSNSYTEWFADGDASIEEAQHLVKQFSVFSNRTRTPVSHESPRIALSRAPSRSPRRAPSRVRSRIPSLLWTCPPVCAVFLLAQLNKIINAPTLEEMREGKEILANEIGVVFKPKAKKSKDLVGQFDPSIVSTEGTVEGGVYSNRAAHFEWLCDVGASIGLSFDELGKRRHGTPATLHFCDKLYEIYGSEDLSVSLGASFAIEHWANAGFWDDLVDGFTKLNKRDGPGVKLSDGTVSHKSPLGFWKFHQALEAQHADHTMDELEEAYAAGRITDEAKFEEAANAMLDACKVFWDGLDADSRGEPLELTHEQTDRFSA